MRSFTLRTSWKKPETLRTLMARRRVVGTVRLGANGLGLRAVVKDEAKGVGAGGGMVAIAIVVAVRRCRRIAVRRARWKRLGVLLRAAMRRLMMRCWMRRRVRVGMRKRSVRVLRVLMVSVGGVGVADGVVDAELRVRLRQRRRLGMRRMSLV